MMTLAIVSQKGGSGKTTIAVHLARAAVEAGYPTCLIDTDPQASAAAWGDWSEAEEPAVITTPPARLGRTVEDAKKLEPNGVIIIDTPPNADVAAREAVKAADLVLVPCRPKTFDMHAVETTAGLVTSCGKAGYVVFNAAPPRAPTLFKEASVVVSRYGLEIVPVMVAERAAFHHSTASGQTALQTEPSGKAAEEIRQLWKWACDHVGMPSRHHDSGASA